MILTDQELSLAKQTTNNFILLIDKLPGIEYFIKSVPLPSITNDAIMVPQPNIAKLYIPGSTIDYEELNVTTLIDENMKYYFSLLNWMRINDSKVDLDDIMFGTCTHILLNNAKEPIIKIIYRDCYPTMLANLSYSIDSADTLSVYFTMRFHFCEYQYNEELLGNLYIKPDGTEEKLKIEG